MTHAAGASHFCYILNGAALFLSFFLSARPSVCCIECREEEEASIHLTAGTYVRYGAR
jgi:hypothetical protein